MADNSKQGVGSRWKINYKLVPVKAHYFFFMAFDIQAMGPILPFLQVFGKQLGVSEIVMGSITGVLPFLFLVAKPVFGYVVDYFQKQRKLVFMGLITAMSTFFVLLYFIPQPEERHNSTEPYYLTDISCQNISTCTPEKELAAQDCGLVHSVNCNYECQKAGNGTKLPVLLTIDNSVNHTVWPCLRKNVSTTLCGTEVQLCDLTCWPDKSNAGKDCLYGTPAFWGFVLLMSLGTIGFNVANSVSDAICFDVLGSGGEMGYGRQRVFGTVGFGITAFLAGWTIDWYSAGKATKDYTPAFVLVFVLTCVDLLCCTKLKVMRYLEDLADQTNTQANIKLLEGLVVAAETLVGEVIFFSLSGRILKRIGYGHTLTLCFLCYAIRLAAISVIPNPWWVLSIELLMQGPTYAMCYTTIVAYASAVSPPGASATMQGLVAGMDDGFGYAIGSMAGGLLYHWQGGRVAFAICATLALVSSVSHGILYHFKLKGTMVKAAPPDQLGLDTSDIFYALFLPLLRDCSLSFHALLPTLSPRQLFGFCVDIVALFHWAGQYQFSPQLLPISFAHVASPSFPFPISIHQPPRGKVKDDQVMIAYRDIVQNPSTFHHVHRLGVTQSDVNVGRSPSSPLIFKGIIRLICFSASPPLPAFCGIPSSFSSYLAPLVVSSDFLFMSSCMTHMFSATCGFITALCSCEIRVEDAAAESPGECVQYKSPEEATPTSHTDLEEIDFKQGKSEDT
uniref:Major facilitator superfamily associated domain-containing protein n=1 Tax=Timema cristinae TaxID=61476 RepID=A0A7R9GXF9_TIMCR|nr:unnamed protein product [Timema cristinae]